MAVTIEEADRVVAQFRRAAELSRAQPQRQGNVVQLASDVCADVLVGGDLHGNRLNFRRLCRLADLEGHSRRHLILQEVCHGGPKYPDGLGCMSHLLLEDVAGLLVQYPGRVHFLLSNHELAELTDFPIVKSNRMLNVQFRSGLHAFYGGECERVRQAALEFVASCPLAVRLNQRILVCHSIPDRVDLHGFDREVFERPLQPQDLAAGGAAFRLVWGRDYRPENVAAFADLMQAEVVIHGHEPCPRGFAARPPRQIVLDCCGSQGCCVLLPLDEALTQRQVAGRIQRLSSHSP